MIIDVTGTRFERGRLILPEEWRLDRNRPLQWWMPQGDRTIYKIVVRNLCGEILWQRPFGDDLVAALKFQSQFYCGDRFDCPSFDMPVTCEVANVALFLSVGTQVWRCPDGITPFNELIPGLFPPGDPNFDPELWEATSGSFTASNSTAADWFTGNKAPSGVTSVDYLVVAGGGGGSGGGGGAGAFRTANALGVTPGTAYTVTVGAGGARGDGSNPGSNGNNSVFSSITANKGGGGGGEDASKDAPTGTFGSGGGGGFDPGFHTGGTGAAGGTGGNSGGNGSSDGSSLDSGGGGGGSNAAGAAGTTSGTSVGGNGGGGTSSSITGSSVTYSGGGGGWGSTTAGTGGSGGGGNGTVGGDGGNATANTGGGGGGGKPTTNFGGNGGSGIIGLTFTAASAKAAVFRRSTRFFTRRF